MAIPYLGAGAAFGFGAESTYGTAVARTRWERAVATGLRRVRSREVVADLAGGVSLNYRHSWTSRDRVRGSIEFFGHFNSYALSTLLRHALGGVSTSGAGDPYSHTFTLTKALPTGLTIEAIMGSDYAEVFEGCKVSRLTLTHEVGSLMRVQADIIGETSGGPTSSGTPSFVADADYSYVTPNLGGTLSFNSVTYTIRRCVVVIDNKLEERDQVGSHSTLEPCRSALQDVTIAVDLERTSDALHTAFYAGTASDVAISFTASASRLITYTLHNCEIFDFDPPASLGGVGPQVQRVTFRAFSDGTDEGLSVLLKNKNSATI